MNKIVYCFWQDALYEEWKQNGSEKHFSSYFHAAINVLSLSIFKSKALGFKVSLFTDLKSEPYLKELPLDHISTELGFLTFSKSLSMQAKMYVIAKQTTPFIYMDWNVVLSDSDLIKQLKNFKEEVLVTSVYNFKELQEDTEPKNPIDFRILRFFSWVLDMSPHYVDHFVQNYETAYDCRIMGFANLYIRDIYIKNFMKCLDISKMISEFYCASLDLRLITVEYLLFCILKYTGASLKVLLPSENKIRAKKLIAPNGTPLIYDNFWKDPVKETIRTNLQTNYMTHQPPLDTRLAIEAPVKISLCTVVMNRKAHLLETLAHNYEVIKKFKGEVDINIVNYNSTDGLEEELFDQPWFVAGLKNHEINYYKNEDALKYHRTLPKNAIHFLAKGRYLFNIDADNFVSESYLTYCLTQIGTHSNIYFRSSHMSDAGTFGRIGIHRNDFEKLGGYNLKIENYGFEDTEITLRLRKLGVHQVSIPSHLCQGAIAHPDELRHINEKETSDNEANSNQKIAVSDHNNRKLGFELYPNTQHSLAIELFKINHKNEKQVVYDTSSYISSQLV